MRGLLCGISWVRFPGVTSNPSFAFFPFRVAFTSFKYPKRTDYCWRGGGGQNERTVGLRFVSQMTISSHRLKITTLHPYLYQKRIEKAWILKWTSTLLVSDESPFEEFDVASPIIKGKVLKRFLEITIRFSLLYAAFDVNSAYRLYYASSIWSN